MLYLVSSDYGRTINPIGHMTLPDFPENTWIVSVRPTGANVFGVSYRLPAAIADAAPTGRLPHRPWRLEPELGMQLDISPRLIGGNDMVEAYLARLISHTLGQAHASGRFDALVLVAATHTRDHLRRHMNAAVRESIVGEIGLPASEKAGALEAHMALWLARRANSGRVAWSG